MCEAIERCFTTLSSFFRWEKMGCMEKVKISNISGIVPPSFFILSPQIWENNGLLNKNYCDTLTL